MIIIPALPPVTSSCFFLLFLLPVTSSCYFLLLHPPDLSSNFTFLHLPPAPSTCPSSSYYSSCYFLLLLPPASSLCFSLLIFSPTCSFCFSLLIPCLLFLPPAPSSSSCSLYLALNHLCHSPFSVSFFLLRPLAPSIWPFIRVLPPSPSSRPFLLLLPIVPSLGAEFTTSSAWPGAGLRARRSAWRGAGTSPGDT